MPALPNAHADPYSAARARKFARLKPRLRLDMAHVWEGGRVNYLTEALRQSTRIIDTDNVSSHGYDATALALIRRHQQGLLLDCGAGSRPE